MVQYVPIDENHPYQVNPLFCNEIGADRLASPSIVTLYAITIVRPFNTYGPRQSTEQLFQQLLHSFLLEKKVNLAH